jgi:predicted amidophosphoribosyltransferase
VSLLGEPGARTGCYLCGRPSYDPDKKSRPWARAVSDGRQVLVCPRCQEQRDDWAAGLDRCERCGATRLSAMLGEVVCRACGAVQARAAEANPTGT